MPAALREEMDVSCPMCRGNRATEELRSWNGYPIMRCQQCSLLFTDDSSAPPADALYPVFDQSGSGVGKSVGGALRVFLRHREAFVKTLKPAGRLLDFGCGNGAFASHMSAAGFDAVGIEPFSLGLPLTGERLRLIRAPLDDVEGELGLFDVITMWHVLEHLRDPVAILERLAAHLAPDGVLVVSVPNFSSVQRGVFQGSWFHLDPPRHLIHFEPSTLNECLGRAGLRPTGSKEFLPEYGCSGWVQSSLNTVFPHYNYLYELVKDRGALQGMSPLSSVLHFAGAAVMAPPLLALSLPLEALASAVKRGAVLTVAARQAA
jgi:SAM-dependent methyltransferase